MKAHKAPSSTSPPSLAAKRSEVPDAVPDSDQPNQKRRTEVERLAALKDVKELKTGGMPSSPEAKELKAKILRNL